MNKYINIIINIIKKIALKLPAVVKITEYIFSVVRSVRMFIDCSLNYNSNTSNLLRHRSAENAVVLQVESFDKGGLEEVVLTLARNLNLSGSVNVVVFVTGNIVGHLGELARQSGIPVFALNQNPYVLRRLIRDLNVTLVNLHYSVFGVHEYYKAGIPLVYTIHNTYIWADSQFVQKRLEQYRLVSQFIAVSGLVKDFFVTKFGVDSNLVTTIPNGLDLEYMATEEQLTRTSFGLNDDDIVFLNVSSFNWHKFHVLMVATMEKLIKRIPNAKLLFVGNTHDVECRSLVEQDIERLGLGSHIKIIEYVPKGRVLGLMRLADCFVLPSLIEGWSIAVMEAMFCELPLILSEVGSARDVITNNDIGIIIRNPFPDICNLTSNLVASCYTNNAQLDNLQDLLTAMETVGREKDKWKERGKIGHEKIVSCFTASHMCQNYLSVYQSLISKE